MGRKINGFDPNVRKEIELLVRWWNLANKESRDAFKRVMPEMYKHLRSRGKI